VVDQPTGCARRGGPWRVAGGENSNFEEQGFAGLTAERPVEGDQSELGREGEGAEVRIGPVFGGGAAQAREVAKGTFEARRLLEERDAVVFEPTVIDLPRLRLIHHFARHDGWCGQKTKKSKLGETAKEEAVIVTQAGKPGRGGAVMDVALKGEGNPDVDIREKK